MKVGRDVIPVFMDYGEAQDLCEELIVLLGTHTSMESAKKYPLLVQLKQKIYNELHKDDEFT